MNGGEAIGFVSVVGFFACVGFLGHAMLRTITRWREITRQTEVVTRLVDRVQGAADAVALLESPAAQSLFDRLVDRRTLVLERVLRAVQAGIVLVTLGGALFTVRPHFMGPDALGFLVVGTISVALGIAFLGAAAVSYLLSRSWGMLGQD